MASVPGNLVNQTPSPVPGVLSTLREALRLFWDSADPFVRRRLVLALALVASGAVLTAMAPLALKLAVDALTPSPDERALLLGPLVLIALHVVAQWLDRSCTELRLWTYGVAEQRVRRRISRRLFEHLVRLPMRFHLERRTGAIGEMAEQGVRGYQLLLSHLVFTILPATVEFLAVAIVLVHIGHDVYLGILGVAGFAYGLAFVRGAVAIHEPARNVSDAHIEAHGVMTDSLLNYETVKYFDAEPIVCDRYDTALGRAESEWRGFLGRRAANGLLVAAIFALALATTLIFAARDVMRGTMTIGAFILINSYVVRLVHPLEMLGLAVRDIAQGLAFLERLLDLLRQQPEQDPGRQDMRPTLPRGELTFERVSFSYHPGKTVLRNVSFTVPSGHTVAVVGMSGAGKSSLIRLLFRLYEPDAGTIWLDDMPIAEMPLSAVRQAIAVVPQDTVLFNDTIARNIGFGRAGSTLLEIEEAARVAHLHELILSLPQGYDTVVGERGLKLSGGERQRVAIARAALKHPRIFVFDEATSSLDSRTEREILRNLIDVSRQATTLVIAHRLSTIVHADHILVLENGEIIERGAHTELIAQGGQYAEIWRVQREERPTQPVMLAGSDRTR